MALIQTVHLSMANFKSAPVVPAVQNDTDRQVKMIIDDYTLTSGLTGKIAFERSDGTHYETAAELVLADNAFIADIDQALTQPGRTMVQLKVTDTLTVSTFSFVIFVEADNSGTVTPQEGIDLVTAVASAEAAADRAESAASTFETDTTLSVEGMAADAKVTGDKIGKLTSDTSLDRIWIEEIKIDGKLGKYDPITINITTRSQYLDVDGVATQDTSSSSWCSSIIPVEIGESYLVTVRSQVTGKYGYIFTDNNFNIIEKGLEGLDDSATLTVRADELVYVPEGATKLILNSCESSGTIISAKKYIFDNVDINVIESNTMAYIKQNYTLQNGYYVKTGTTFTENASYFSAYEPCVPGDKFKVSTYIKDSPVSIIQYYKADGSLLSYVDNSGTLPETVTDYSATAPDQAAYFSVTSYQTRPTIYKFTLDVEPEGFPLYLHRRNALAEVMFKYSAEKDAIVIFNKVGPNNILQIAGFYTVENANRHCSGDFDATRTTLRNAGSDWMSPYKVIAVNDADGDGSGQGVNGFYTGGFHAYNGDQTGSATGETTSYQFFVDGEEITATADTVYPAAKEVVIIVTNEIQGNNTTKSDGSGRAILQEQIKYTITPNRIDVVNVITALEDIIISQYYGLQLYAFSNMNGFEYFGDTHEIHDFTADTSYTDEIDYLVGGISTDPDRLVCQLDKKGIGRHQYVASGGIMARSITGRKVYNNLVDNANHLPLSEDDSVYISGHYAFAEGYIPN